MATHEGSLEITTDIDSPSAGETTSLTESKESTDGVRKRTSSKAAKTEEDEPKKKNKPWGTYVCQACDRKCHYHQTHQTRSGTLSLTLGTRNSVLIN